MWLKKPSYIKARQVLAKNQNCLVCGGQFLDFKQKGSLLKTLSDTQPISEQAKFQLLSPICLLKPLMWNRLVYVDVCCLLIRECLQRVPNQPQQKTPQNASLCPSRSNHWTEEGAESPVCLGVLQFVTEVDLERTKTSHTNEAPC